MGKNKSILKYIKMWEHQVLLLVVIEIYDITLML